MKVQNITGMIGNTPLLKVEDNVEYYAKIEGSNLVGSVKDRAKYEVTKKSIAEEYEPVRMDTSEDKEKIEGHSVKKLIGESTNV